MVSIGLASARNARRLIRDRRKPFITVPSVSIRMPWVSRSTVV